MLFNSRYEKRKDGNRNKAEAKPNLDFNCLRDWKTDRKKTDYLIKWLSNCF